VGKNNKLRRAEKAKARQRAASQRRASTGSSGWQPGSGPIWDDDELVAGLIDLAPGRLAAGDEAYVARIITRLSQFPATFVRLAAAAELRRTIAAMWSGGWQPAEISRHVGRQESAIVVRLAHAAIAADHAARSPATLDPRWVAQLDALDLPTVTSGSPEVWVAHWADATGLDRSSELRAVFELLVVLRSVTRIDELIPPPGGSTRPAASRAPAASSSVDRAVLDRVRALLVKAESTTFEAEAEAFTAKAHELMARHAIDAALLEAERSGAGSADAPITIRIAIDDPYADAKSLLLQIVAEASRCRAVFHGPYAMTSVLGFATDVAATEMLYTSLLVQAQSALATAARNAAPGSRPRSRSFRSAFLVAYANRIGQRLDGINAAMVAEAEQASGRSVLPVLRDRQSVIDDVIAERFGDLTSSPVRGGLDAAGWASGRHAADQARLNFGDLEGSTA
jgi:hypothetical protein